MYIYTVGCVTVLRSEDSKHKIRQSGAEDERTQENGKPIGKKRHRVLLQAREVTYTKCWFTAIKTASSI